METREITIPRVLQNPDFRFVRISFGKKIPTDDGWNTTGNFSFDAPEIIAHIRSGKNYGVVGGFGNLIILDFDSAEVQECVVPRLPPTFSVKTARKGLLHLYYRCTERLKTFRCNNELEERVIDVQGIGSQVVGANSYNTDSGRYYEVVDDVPIATISSDLLLGALREWLPKEEKRQKTDSTLKRLWGSLYSEHSLFKEKVKQNLSISSVLASCGVDTRDRNTWCGPLFHSSDNKKCLRIHDESSPGWAYCFHENVAHDHFSFYMRYHNCDFKTALRHLSKMAGLESDYMAIFVKKQVTAVEAVGDDPKQPVTDVMRLIDEDATIGEEQKVRLRVNAMIKRGRIETATEIMADYLYSQVKMYTIRADGHAEVWIYQDGIYAPNGGTYIIEMVRRVMRLNFDMMFTRAVADKIHADTYITQEEFFEETAPELVCVKNGILNVLTRQFTSHTASLRFFSKVPVTYDPTKDCPGIRQFLTELFRDEKEVQVIQELFGFCLYRDYFIEKAFMFIGGGRNGKGKTLALLSRFLGHNNCVELTLQDIEQSHFALINFHRKLVNIAGDVSSRGLEDTSIFKKLTGRDRITADRKHLDCVSFKNYAKMVFSCNQLPATKDTTPAFFNRWIIIEFPFSFRAQSDIDQDPSLRDNPLTRRQEPERVDSLLADENEFSGLLNWAVEGLARLRQEKSFSHSPSTANVRKQWLALANSFQDYFDKHLEFRAGAIITKEALRDSYYAFCVRPSLVPPHIESDRSIYTTLSKNGVQCTRRWVDGENVRCWLNIAFKDARQEPLFVKDSYVQDSSETAFVAAVCSEGGAAGVPLHSVVAKTGQSMESALSLFSRLQKVGVLEVLENGCIRVVGSR